jgi:hypothetical protein
MRLTVWTRWPLRGGSFRIPAPGRSSAAAPPFTARGVVNAPVELRAPGRGDGDVPLADLLSASRPG